MSVPLWLTENRSEVCALGSASFEFTRALLNCWSMVTAIRDGDPTVTGVDLTLALWDFLNAGKEVVRSIRTLHRKCRANGKGAPTSHSDAPIRK